MGFLRTLRLLLGLCLDDHVPVDQSKLFDNHNMLVTTIYVNYLSLFDHRSLGDVEISSDSIIGT